MNRPITFSSPFPSPDCFRRLQKLADSRNLYAPSGRFGVVHVIVDSLETSAHSFSLLLKCSTRGDSFLPFIYLRLNGEIHASNGETRVQIWLQLDQPHSPAEWAVYGFWVVLVAISMAGGIIKVWTSTPLQSILIASMFILAVTAGFWVHRQTYRISVNHVLNLIYHTLRHEGVGPRSHETNEVEWLSSLAKSK